MKAKKKKTTAIGVTGGIGTGKSTVAKVFAKFGAMVLDADMIAHEALKRNTGSYKEVVEVFGRCILDKSGRINRAKLGDLAFSNKKALNKLCNIIHPIVLRKIKKSINAVSKSKGASAVVIDAPLLIEAGLHKDVDYLVVVKTSKATQVKRARKKTGLSVDNIMKRIGNQMPLSRKIKMADYVVNNEKNKSNTEKIIKKIWEGIKSGERK